MSSWMISCSREQRGNRVELVAVRQLAVDQEVGRLDEASSCSASSSIGIAAVAEDALLAVDEGDGALAWTPVFA